jgi:transposase
MSRARSQSTMLDTKVTIGLDLGDKLSRTYELGDDGRCVGQSSVATTREALTRYFRGRASCRVVLEAGTHSPWIARLLEAMGHEVVVANPTEVFGSRRRKKKNDQIDAEFLARQGRADPALLCPVQHRSEQAQQHLELLKARDQVVKLRTDTINHVRGTVKAVGYRLPRCSAEAFAKVAAAHVPDALRMAVLPLLDLIATFTTQIRMYDRQVAQLIRNHYPIAEHLQQPRGVGPITALAYVLLVDDPYRFRRSRAVGAYFGLVPRLDRSSDADPQLRITKAGDAFGRRLLVSAAQYILGPFGPDCDLRRYGEQLAARGGKNAKKRAVVAVARKLAVLLHHLWVTEATYDPAYNQRRAVA